MKERIQLAMRIDKELHDQLMFKLYALHEKTGHKITKSALIIGLIEAFIDGNVKDFTIKDE